MSYILFVTVKSGCFYDYCPCRSSRHKVLPRHWMRTLPLSHTFPAATVQLSSSQHGGDRYSHWHYVEDWSSSIIINSLPTPWWWRPLPKTYRCPVFSVDHKCACAYDEVIEKETFSRPTQTQLFYCCVAQMCSHRQTACVCVCVIM